MNDARLLVGGGFVRPGCGLRLAGLKEYRLPLADRAPMTVLGLGLA